MNKLLEIKNLNVEWYTQEGYVSAVHNVSFSLHEGEIVGLLGESGAGKSTVGLAILKLINPPHKVTGSIIYNGKNILELGQKEVIEYRWKAVSMVFQAAMNVLDPVHTIEDNFYPLLKDKGIVRNKRENREKVLELLNKVKLSPEVAKLYPHQLSGGMKQRIVIALAISTNPDILIADEPTTALDTITQFSILNLLKSLVANKMIKSILFISHDLSVQAYISDKIIVMYHGTILEKGKKEEIIKNPLHPYTQILFSSVNFNKDRKMEYRRNDIIKNNGCVFASVCPYRSNICLEKQPSLSKINVDHYVACFLYWVKKWINM